MALAILARRLGRSQPALLLPYFPISSLAPGIVTHSTFETYHQALVAFRYTLSKNIHFSKDQTFLNPKLNGLFVFNDIDTSQDSDQLDVSKLINLLTQKNDFRSGDEALNFLDKSGVTSSKDVILSAIWALREEWKLAFLVYKWGEKRSCIVEKARCLMIWILGNHNKFGTAWSLIQDLLQNSVDTRQPLLILIDRYAAANQSRKAIQTFQFIDKFSLSPNQRTFFTFLNILCIHGNIEEAEEFMFLSKKLFPLETEGFNIILDGWCNVAVDILEAKRIWREMSKCCILPNGTTYTHMISCFSKVGNLFDSLRLYDEMKKKGFTPGIEVYNSLAYILARENCLKDALNIIDKIKDAGLNPDSTTYNSVIHPLCEAARGDDARAVLVQMIGDGIRPTVDTYHAFLQDISPEGAFDVIKHMKKACLGPNKDTFLLSLKKFFEKEQPENAMKIWLEMQQYDVLPDSVHYTLCVEGLAKCGLLVKAKEVYLEMGSKGFGNDAKLEKLLKGQENNSYNDVRRLVYKNGRSVAHMKKQHKKS